MPRFSRRIFEMAMEDVAAIGHFSPMNFKRISFSRFTDFKTAKERLSIYENFSQLKYLLPRHAITMT